jgi:hypothetical protein
VLSYQPNCLLRRIGDQLVRSTTSPGRGSHTRLYPRTDPVELVRPTPHLAALASRRARRPAARANGALRGTPAEVGRQPYEPSERACSRRTAAASFCFFTTGAMSGREGPEHALRLEVGG